MAKKIFISILKLILIAIIFLGVYIISTIIGPIIKALCDPIYITEIYNVIDKKSPLTFSDLISEATLYTVLVICTIATILFIIYTKKKKEKPIKQIKARNSLVYVALGLAINAATYWALSNGYNVDTYNYESIPFTLIVSGILTPFIEELVYRYLVFKIFSFAPLKVVIPISAAIFGVAHLANGNIGQFIFAFATGLAFGFLYSKLDNLLPSIIIHASINCSSIMFIRLNGFGDTIFSIITLIICLTAVITTIFYIKKLVAIKKAQIHNF